MGTYLLVAMILSLFAISCITTLCMWHIRSQVSLPVAVEVAPPLADVVPVGEQLTQQEILAAHGVAAHGMPGGMSWP